MKSPYIGTRGRVEIRPEDSAISHYYDGLIESVDDDTVRVIPSGIGGMPSSYPSEGRVTISMIRDIDPI